jgi:cytochrome c oxidase cbb3-type subunit 2
MSLKNRWKLFLKSEKSLILTISGVLVLFGLAIAIVVVAPSYVDESWVEPCCSYQVQMHDVSDPNFYINAASLQPDPIEYVRHIKQGYSLLSFEEKEHLRIVAPENMQKFVTKLNQTPLIITTELLFLRDPQKTDDFDAIKEADALRDELSKDWEEKNPDWESEDTEVPFFEIKELYNPHLAEGFGITKTDDIFELWTESDFIILDKNESVPYQANKGIIYIQNPEEYLVGYIHNGVTGRWEYKHDGKRVDSLKELTGKKLGFVSRKDLIDMGENIYKIEGCWYCHTDQTRTLVEDCVVNGTPFYPAPPSSANEYIFQQVTFPGTKRNGPDLSRIGIRKQSRDWHRSHFWSPRSKSKGSIMPSFKHFFDVDPEDPIIMSRRVPNCKFEAIYQYLMTKGTRITSPNEAWWEGKDPMNTISIIGSRGDKNVDKKEGK